MASCHAWHDGDYAWNPSLFAEIERELLSLRTKEGLAAARAAGKKLGRPKGSKGKSKLDGKEKEIQHLLDIEVSKASIAKIMGVDRATLYHFIRSRHLVTEATSQSVDHSAL